MLIYIAFLSLIFLLGISTFMFYEYFSEGNKRKVIIYRDKHTTEAKFKDLKQGDIFSLFEPNGLAVRTRSKNRIFIALSDIYLNKDGVNTIDCEPYIK